MRLSPILWLAGLLPHVISASQETKDGLLEWFHQHGGSLNSKQEVRLEEPEKGENSRFAVFAKDAIPEGEVLASVPWDIVASPEDFGTQEFTERQEQHDFDCELVRTLVTEMKNSQSLPYVQHLQSQPERFNLPSSYSIPGKKLFARILGGPDYSRMFVDNAISLHPDWAVSCQFDQDDEITMEAVLLVTKFSYLGLMIPMHNFYTHRGGHYLNTKVTIVAGDHVQIEARRDIAAGEQLHTSFDEFESAPENPAELLRDHGIVSNYPHHWSIPGTVMMVPVGEEDEQLEMAVHSNSILYNLTQDDETGKIEIQMDPKANPHEYFLHSTLLEKIQDLNHLKNIEMKSTAQENGVPQHEWDTLMDFLDIFVDGLKRSFHQVHQGIKSSTPIFDRVDAGTSSQDVCDAEDYWGYHYNLFWPRFDSTAYNDADCRSSEWTEFPTYSLVEKEKSNYQELEWKYREEDDDTCLHLDNMLQICSGYRPHYHEFFVHYAARYVPSVKRVIYLGSGDAMLLHEILKYPDLEKVVGLELDQFVTRKSFKHFKTQPHYDDPRVEWWYGDATKTLPLLPRDYWGSFDLLLVDLSETVVSLHVTGKHDVLDVISNLLKPEGVMFENELYLHAMSRHFDHTVQIFYGSPKVCTQVQSVSSNKVDFMRSPIYDHGVDMFLIDKVEQPWDRFKYIHDYVNSDAHAIGQCEDDGNNEPEHGRKAGVLMVLEAEETSIKLDGALGGVVVEALRAAGLTPVTEPSPTENGTIQVVMNEGYVVARPWPELNYVGFDIGLWGSYHKMENVRTALTKALGSKSDSSFRIVVGGMHGSSTWEEDQNLIGVQFSQSRDCTVSDLSSKDLDEDEVVTAALDESLDLIPDATNLTVLVLCGSEEDAEECTSVKRMSSFDDVERVIPIWTCDDIPDYNDGSEDFDSMIECEKKLIAELDSHYDKHEEFDMIAVDFSAPSSMLQVFVSILGFDKFRTKWMEPAFVVSVPFRLSDTHRVRFVDLLRTSFDDAPAALSEWYFQGDDNDFVGFSALVYGNPHAVYQIALMEDALTERLPNVEVDLHAIFGGPDHTADDMEIEKRTFLPEDYDMEPNRKQFQEQRPLGRQTIFQLELSDSTSAMPPMKDLADALKVSLLSIGVEAEEFEVVTDVGDGGVVLSRFGSGNAVLTWDGAEHMDINLFVLDQDKTVVDSFLESFLEQTGGQLHRTLRDDQPRGIGRVVSFQSDIDGDERLDDKATA